MHKIDQSYTDFNAHQSAAALNIARGNRSLQGMRASVDEIMLSRTPHDNATAKDNLATSRGVFESSLNAAETEAKARSQNIEAFKARGLAILDQDCAASLNAASAATTDSAILDAQHLYLKDCSPNFPPLVHDMKTLGDSLEAETTAGAQALNQATNAAAVTTFVLFIVGLALLTGGGVLAVRAWVVTPLMGLLHIMDRLAKGDLQVRVEGVERGDEVGAMSRAVQVFKDAGLEKQRLEAEAETQRNMTEEERRKAEEMRARAARNQAQVVNGLAEGLEKLSSGDLTYRLRETFAEDYEKLRADFNAAMATLQETMKTVVGRTDGLRSGGSEIAQASDDLSKRTEQQAASLEETAAALDQITATVKRTADGALEARNVVAVAKSDAERSSEVVREAVAAMTQIETSSREIGQIIGVIDEIAFQTNLLALNAGVEAARAGDAGRGFAVVASEVRALAQRSADAAKEIKALISASEAQVAQGVERVGETGKALARIAEQVTRINGVIAEIAASAQEQASGLHQVNAAMNQMDQVTQQNAAMVEQSTAATHSLREETDALSDLIAQFQVGEISRVRAAPPAATTARSNPVHRLRDKLGRLAGGRP
jgi:methyl-accepting chemotaxis protein